MNKIRETKGFKFTALFLVFLFIFQADFLLANKETDHEKQYKLAVKEFKKGKDENYRNAKKRLEFLIGILDEKDKKQAQLLEKAKTLLKEIEIRLKLHIIEKEKKERKKKKFPWLLVVGGTIVAGVLVYFFVIKKAKKYKLTVNKGTGVDGNPDSGTYTYKKGEIVNYSYRLQAGYNELTVQLDGHAASPSGTITMDGNHNLSATATELGSIKVESTPAQASIWLDNTDTGQKTPAVLENIIPGSHTVKLLKQGYQDYETTVNVEPGLQATVSAALKMDIGIEWITIPAGEFKMGDNFFEGDPHERPVHTVYLDQYNISKYEVTFEQYDKFCQDTGRTKPGDEGWGRGNRPVINVSWYDAKAFCDWLSQKTGENIHLPTEAQWEKAARGTDQRRYPWGNSSPSCSLANHSGCGSQTKPVGSHPSGVSPYGVHDMAGNAWEWCSDWYSSTYYSISPGNNPMGPSSGSERILRGGSWISTTYSIRSANRFQFNPANGRRRIGFRICQD